MSARTKLNSAWLIAALIPATVLGLVFQSWAVFCLVALAIVGAALSSGGIRPTPGRHGK